VTNYTLTPTGRDASRDGSYGFSVTPDIKGEDAKSSLSRIWASTHSYDHDENGVLDYDQQPRALKTVYEFVISALYIQFQHGQSFQDRDRFYLKYEGKTFFVGELLSHDEISLRNAQTGRVMNYRLS
jgi:hypothetical protein